MFVNFEVEGGCKLWIALPGCELIHCPGKNGFSKQQNKRGTGRADNIYIFYQREWPGQIAHTKYTLSLALGL